MRRITLAVVSTIAALVLLFSYRTSTSGPDGRPAVAAGANPVGIVGGTGTGTSASGSMRVNGEAVQTRWGPVQIQLLIELRKIVDIVVLVQPDGNRRDVEINSYALPLLREQVLSAQSADIQGVSGATVTSEGYIASLRSALEAAHLNG